MPYSPNVTRVPPLAEPCRSGWCCLRCLTRRGMSIAQLSSSAVASAEPGDVAVASAEPDDVAVASAEPDDVAVASAEPDDVAVASAEPDDSALVVASATGVSATGAVSSAGAETG